MLCMPVPVIGMQPSETPTTPIGIGDSVTRELRGSEVHRFALSRVGDIRVAIENQGRGTILDITKPSGERILRTANWRNSEGLHSATLTVDDPVILTVLPDEAIAPPGNYRLSVHSFTADDSFYEAERAMSLGADLLLKHYFGEADTREDALSQLLLAAEKFRAGDNRPRLADALFEAAGVNFNLGEHREAARLYLEAEELWRSLGDERGLSSAELQRGLIDWRTNKLESAIRLFQKTAIRRKNLGDTFFHAQAINNLGLVYRYLGDARSAIQYFEQALENWQGDIDLLAANPGAVDFNAVEQPPWLFDALIAMNNLGWATELLADTGRTERILLQALSLSEYLNRGRMAAEIRSNLGRLKYKTGDLQSALDYADESLAYFTSSSTDEIWASHSYQTRALVYRATGDIVRAELALREALRLRTAERDPVSRAETILALAELTMEDNRTAETLDHIDSALALLGEGHINRSIRARSFDLAGRAYLAAARHDLAVSNHNTAVDLYASAGDIRGEAVARANRALTRRAMGPGPEPDADLREALRLSILVEDRLLRFRILTEQAHLFTLNGQQKNALETANEALSISERLREEIVDPVLLRYFAATQRNAHDVLVAVAIAEGDLERAWLAADEARARRFNDLLGQSESDNKSLSDSQQLRYETLLQMRAARTEERTALLSRKHPENIEKHRENIARVRSELSAIVSEIDNIHSRVAGSPASKPTPVSLSKLQSVLGDTDVLLEFYFGNLTSGVWQIGRESISYRAIPGLTDISSDLTPLLDSVRRYSNEPPAGLHGLSSVLLGAKRELDASASNIIVVPDGPLYYLPFSVLLDPATDFREPLIASRNVSYLPSVAALFELTARDRDTGTGIAVVADPIFTRDDPRAQPLLAGSAPAAAMPPDRELLRSAERAGRTGFSRLPGTGNESRAIGNAAGDNEVFVALGADANRELVLSGALNGFRIIHFATHGILDAEEPALSGLVLSAISADGTPQLQFLRSQDVATLKLRADLIVLSGCDTGLGRMVRGEGLVGLSRAFFYAGANQVVSSLWPVPDRATAELMRHFYREMLQNGLSPASALRRAKLSIRAERRWQEPYYWAAFIIQGDWTQSATGLSGFYQSGERPASGAQSGLAL